MSLGSDNHFEGSIGERPDQAGDGRSAAPLQVYRSKVYRAEEGQDWIVEPPRDRLSGQEKRVFSGPCAQYLALAYAYETFGNARFFPY
jgi:hypothetical protein